MSTTAVGVLNTIIAANLSVISSIVPVISSSRDTGPGLSSISPAKMSNDLFISAAEVSLSSLGKRKYVRVVYVLTKKQPNNHCRRSWLVTRMSHHQYPTLPHFIFFLVQGGVGALPPANTPM